MNEIDNNSKDFLKSEISNIRSKSINRIQFEAEVDLIKRQIGDLESIRLKLGLSARKMTQLLLVDPSAWTRWTQKTTQPPPHIYRALQWYLALQEKNPGFTPQFFLNTQVFSKGEQHKDLIAKTQQLHEQLSDKITQENDRLRTLEKRLEIYKKQSWILFIGLILMTIIFIFKTMN